MASSISNKEDKPVELPTMWGYASQLDAAAENNRKYEAFNKALRLKAQQERGAVGPMPQEQSMSLGPEGSLSFINASSADPRLAIIEQLVNARYQGLPGSAINANNAAQARAHLYEKLLNGDFSGYTGRSATVAQREPMAMPMATLGGGGSFDTSRADAQRADADRAHSEKMMSDLIAALTQKPEAQPNRDNDVYSSARDYIVKYLRNAAGRI